jgi:2-phosphosulfolactate phosphatase
MICNQQEFDIRLEWGLRGVQELAPISDVVIIVDILSFSTCVDIATANSAFIFPYPWKDETSIEYAKSIGAILASTERKFSSGYSLSPTSLTSIPPNTRLVLPSPNGSTLTLATGNITTICGCLRNAKAVAEYALRFGKKISVIPAGEQWTDNTLRPAFEDLVGAGAIINYLAGSFSPESKSALSAFKNLNHNLVSEIRNCCSGKELIDRGFEKDIYLACELNISDTVPKLQNSAYIGLRNIP